MVVLKLIFFIYIRIFVSGFQCFYFINSPYSKKKSFNFLKEYLNLCFFSQNHKEGVLSSLSIFIVTSFYLRTVMNNMSI